jgi:precorrin-6B methylase 2
MMNPRASEVVDRLMDERPQFHQSTSGEDVNWGIQDRVLFWLAENVQPGDRTLEIGCGYSTIVFAAAGADHTAIAPAEHEFERIRDWLQSHELPAVRLVSGFSQNVLPNFDLTDLDLVLIDGDHGFPFPTIDWFYTVHRLKVGGRLVLDDIHMRAVGVLHDFLAQEQGRWKLCQTFARSSVFQKLVADPFSGVTWRHQPWGAQTKLTPLRFVNRFVVAPGRRLVKKSDRLTSWLRPLYRKHIKKRL